MYSIVLVLFYVAAVLSPPAMALTCESANFTAAQLSIAFPLRSAPGQRSAIVADQAITNTSDNSSRATLSMAVDTALPLIVVLLQSIDPYTGNTLPDLSQRGYMVSVATIAPSSILLKGAAVAVANGKAVYANLIPTECVVDTTYVFSFSLRSELGDALDVDPIYANVLCRSATASSNASTSTITLGDSGFLTRTTAATTPWIPSGVLIPSFSVSVFNLAGSATSTTDIPLTVTFSGNSSSASRTVLKLAASTSVSVDTLMFTPSTTSALYTSLVVSSPGLTPLSIPLRVIQANLPNTFLRFATSTSSSYITQVGQSLSWVAGIPLPPIQVQFLTSKGVLDTSTSGLIVTASCAEDPYATGTHAASVQGTATFDSLTFSARSAPLSYGVITFTASASTVVRGPSVVSMPQSLYTGAITITSSPLQAALLAFSDQSSMTATATTTILVDSSNSFTLTNIIVLVLDSSNILDTTANNIVLQLQLNAQGSSGITPVVSGGGTATVSSGVAVFTSVVCNNGGEGAMIQVCVNDPTGARQQICSGTVVLSTGASSPAADIQQCASSASNVAADCAYSLAWGASPRSLVYYNGQPVFATVGAALPMIQISLQDAFGDVSSPLDTSIVPKIVAYTGTTPAAERYLSSEGRVGYWMSTYYVFSCLRFARKPPGSVTIKFSAVWSLTSQQLFAFLPTLETGFVRVASRITGSYGLRFAATNMIFSYAGQSSTAVIGVALPSIQVEVMNSNYMLDTAANNLIIDVTASSGALSATGSAETVINGVATFRLLTFTSGGLEPLLTFKVRGSSLSASTVATLSGVIVSTGVVLVTSATIPAASIVFVATASNADYRNITQPYQPFLFNDFSDATLKVAVAITDSAHVVASSAERTVTILQTSSEAVLASNQEVTIQQGSSSTAFFDAVILSQQSGYSGAPIYIQFVVTAPTSSPILVGNTITIGPIFIGTQLLGLLDSGIAQCITQYYTPIMVITFFQPILSFNLSAALVSASTLLSLETDKAITTASTTSAGTGLTTLGVVALQAYSPSWRLLPMRVEATASSDPVTLARWVGTKVVFGLRNTLTPFAASANNTVLSQRTPRDLAIALAAYRPTCSPSTGTQFSTSTNGYSIQHAGYAIDDATCVSSLFVAAVSAAQNCSTSGYLTQCQCYSLYAMSNYGGLCAPVPSLSSTFTSLCQGVLSGCSEPSIVIACATFAAASETSTAAYLALLALIALPLAGLGYYIFRRSSANKTLMNKEKQIQQDEVREPIGRKVSRFFKKSSEIVGV